MCLCVYKTSYCRLRTADFRLIRTSHFGLPTSDLNPQQPRPFQRRAHFIRHIFHDKSELKAWGKENTWTKLEIINSSEKEVEFKAYFTDKFGKENIHHELSTFKKVDKKWYYVSGKFLD